jgi:biopolymer transport protein TolR
MAMAVGGKKGGPMADINVTPMADVMIVLLIIFMVITPLLQKGVDVKLPTAGNTKERKDEPKIPVVAVRKDMTTYLTQGTTTQKLDNQADLLPQLREQMRDLAEGTRMIYLKADEQLPYSAVMKVMDLAREAGVEEVALIAERKVQG